METIPTRAAEPGRVDAFVARLEGLDAGARARLRRSAGKTLQESTGALSLFYRLLPPDVPAYQQDAYFLVATLFPLGEGDEQGRRNFGAALRVARNDQNASGLDRRVEILLDADTEQLPFRLRQAVHFVQSNRVPVCWSCLLQDILGWGSPEHYVQRRWAEAYFGQPAPNQRPAEPDSGTAKTNQHRS